MSKSAKVTIEILAKDLTKAAISGVRAGLSGIASAFSALAKAGAGAGVALLAFTRFAVLGEHDAAIAARFAGAMRSLGLSATDVLQRLHAASGGLVEQSEVMRTATQALKGGKFSLDQTALAMEFLRLKAVSTGQDVAEFTKNGIDGLSRGMARGLLPLFPDLNRQLEQLANSGIDGARQKSETLRLVFQRMIETLPELRTQVGATTVGAQQFGIALKDAASDIAQQVASSPETKRFFQDILTNVKALVAKLPEILPAVENAIQGLARLAGDLASIFVKAINGWNQLLDLMHGTPQTVEASGLAQALSAAQDQLEKETDPNSIVGRRIKGNITQFSQQLSDAILAGGKLVGVSARELANVFKVMQDQGLLDDWLKGSNPVLDAILAAQTAANSRAQGLKFGPAAGPAPVAAPAPKLDLSNLGGDTNDVGQQLADLEDKYKQLQLTIPATGQVTADYIEKLHALSAAIRAITSTQHLQGPELDKATSLQKELTGAVGDATTRWREASAVQKDFAAEFDATTLAGGRVANALALASQAAERADLGVGSFEEAHRAAEKARDVIHEVADALVASDLPAEELAAALHKLHEAEQGIGTGATQGLLDMKLLLTEIAQTTIAGFTDAIAGAFQAMVEGSMSAATAFKVGMLKAIAAVASGLAQMMVGKAVEQIAEALAHPATAGHHLASAAKFTAAAALFGAISGVLSGAAANTAGGGGSAGGSPSATTAASATDKGSGTIVIQGGLLDMSDPRQADAFGQAVSDLTGRGIIVQKGSGD